LNTERFNTSLLDNLTTAVVVLSADLTLYHLNPSAEALLDTSSRHCHALKVTELFRNHEELLRALDTVEQSETTVIIRKVNSPS